MIEKTLERLKEEARYSQENAEKSTDISAINFCKGSYGAYIKAIAIVKEVAKEYVPDTKVGEWIPVEERLPECCGYPVLLTVENRFGQRDVCKAFTNYMKEGKLLFYTNEKEFCSELTSSKLRDAWKPIAWQPLPAPYQKGE